MKKMMLAVVLGSACLCGAQQVEQTLSPAAERVVRAEAELKRATEAKDAAKRALKEAQAALEIEKQDLKDTKEAKKKGLSLEEYREQRLARHAAAAEVSLEQWKTMTEDQRNARKRAVGDAKKYKVSVTDWLAMTPEQQKAKKDEAKASQKAEKSAK